MHGAGEWGLLATLRARASPVPSHGRQMGGQGPQWGNDRANRLLEGEEKGDSSTSHEERK